MSNVFDLEAFKRKKEDQFNDPLFQKQIDRMDKLQLMEEMIKYQEKKSEAKDPNNLFWNIRGFILFRAIEAVCSTDELRLLAGSYKRHCEHEINLKRGPKK